MTNIISSFCTFCTIYSTHNTCVDMRRTCQMKVQHEQKAWKPFTWIAVTFTLKLRSAILYARSLYMVCRWEINVFCNILQRKIDRVALLYLSILITDFFENASFIAYAFCVWAMIRCRIVQGLTNQHACTEILLQYKLQITERHSFPYLL